MVKLRMQEPPHIFCKAHPRYLAFRKPKGKCHSCLLLYVLNWQHSKHVHDKLGGLNPYSYILSGIDLEDACSGLKIRNEYQKPGKMPFMRTIEKAKRWMRSKKGKAQIAETRKKIEKIMAELNEARKISPDSLNHPMTI